MPDDDAANGAKPLATKIGTIIITAILSGGLGFIGTWFTTQAKVDDAERRIAVLEASTASKEQTRAVLDAINAAQSSADHRLSTIESVLMKSR